MLGQILGSVDRVSIFPAAQLRWEPLNAQARAFARD
jgi:hypothetical protein